MAHLNTNSHMEFNFEGQFLGFVSHDGTLKYMRLKVLSEEMQIKIPKAMSGFPWGLQVTSSKRLPELPLLSQVVRRSDRPFAFKL